MIKIVNTDAGYLGALALASIPFEAKRLYWLGGTPKDSTRGLHAHKELIQFIICCSGSVDIELDTGSQISKHHLDVNSKGLLIMPCQWRILRNFSEDALLLVIASAEYDPDDYIHSYSEFIEWVSTK